MLKPIITEDGGAQVVAHLITERMAEPAVDDIVANLRSVGVGRSVVICIVVAELPDGTVVQGEPLDGSVLSSYVGTLAGDQDGHDDGYRTVPAALQHVARQIIDGAMLFYDGKLEDGTVGRDVTS